MESWPETSIHGQDKFMRRKKILVAEDDPAVLDFYCEVLHQEGYRVLTATDGRQALERIRQEKPDLAILDMKRYFRMDTN